MQSTTQTSTQHMTNTRVHRFLAAEKSVRIAAVDATEVVELMRSIQNTQPLSTVAVGRTMLGALLMASHLKDSQEVGLDFNVNGPLHRVYAQASAQGGVRGFVFEPNVGVSPDADSLSLRKAMGIGLLTVSTHVPFQETPHRGVVHVVSGEIGEDIAFYFQQSHQIPTIVSLGVHLDVYGRVNAAGGILVELMPEASMDVIEKLEQNLSKARGISQQILDGKKVEEVVKDLTEGMDLQELDHPHKIHYSCSCSHERVLRSLSLLGVDDLRSAIAEEKPLSTQCQMCGSKYEIPIGEMEELVRKLEKEALH